MRRTVLVQILFILLLLIFVSNLFADKANQQKLEAKFRADTNFEGTITWWDCDDTMYDLHGTFTNLTITPDTDLKVTLVLVDKIFKSLLPYTGVQSTDFLPVVGDYSSFSYFQKLNNRTISRYGTIFIDVFDGNVGIYVYTLPKMTGALNPKITVETAYSIFAKVAAPGDIIPQAKIVSELTYLASPAYVDNSLQKPTDFRLTWMFKGTDKWYYIDAENGELLKTE